MARDMIMVTDSLDTKDYREEIWLRPGGKTEETEWFLYLHMKATGDSFVKSIKDRNSGRKIIMEHRNAEAATI